MILPDEIRQALEIELGEYQSFKPVSGGCINNGGIAEFTKDSFFIKWNDVARFPDMFEKEANGLKLLSLSSLKIPKVIHTGKTTNYAYLVLEKISPGIKNQQFWKELGERLAQMHQISNDAYGADSDNYMGSLKQANTPHKNWISFYLNERLVPQVALGFDNNLLSQSDLKRIDSFYNILSEILIEESPALVHGDLWSGNIMCSTDQEPVLIDPAVSFSQREVDLAMTRLFGGFDRIFYEAYNDIYPTAEGIEDRIDIYQLYPLLIHLNLFGSGYYHQCISIINRFTS